MQKTLCLIVLAFLSSQTMAKGTEISVFSGYRAGGDLEDAETGKKNIPARRQ